MPYYGNYRCIRKKKPQMIYLYLLQDGSSDIYKIGITGSEKIYRRLAVIRMHIKEIRLVDYVYCDARFEMLFHKRFKHKNVGHTHGFKEFFRLTEEDVAFVLYFMERKRRTVE